MRIILTALAAAATVAVTAIATPTTADARWRGWGWRGPAFVGGLAIGAAFATPYAYRSYGPYAAYGYGGSYASYGYAGGSYASHGYYGGPYAAYASPVYYRGYSRAPIYSCARKAWNGYRWVRYDVC